MSKSIHITIKNFRGLTKIELNEQLLEPSTELAEWKKNVNKKKK
jgi:hypothetical protein